MTISSLNSKIIIRILSIVLLYCYVSLNVLIKTYKYLSLVAYKCPCWLRSLTHLFSFIFKVPERMPWKFTNILFSLSVYLKTTIYTDNSFLTKSSTLKIWANSMRYSCSVFWLACQFSSGATIIPSGDSIQKCHKYIISICKI